MIEKYFQKVEDTIDDFSEDKVQLALSEYQSLREEILKRSDFRFRIISFFLLIAGTMISLGLQPKSPSYVLFAFPIIGCFLASLWVHNLSWGSRAADFIKHDIYKKFNWQPGWENHEPHFKSYLTRTTFSVRGIFIGTQTMTILLGLLLSYAVTTADYLYNFLRRFLMRKIQTLFILVLASLIFHCSVRAPEVTVTGEKTALENQVIGTYELIEGDTWMIASTRGSTKGTSQKMSIDKREVLEATQNRKFNKDDIDEFKQDGVLGENNRGFLEFVKPSAIKQMKSIRRQSMTLWRKRIATVRSFMHAFCK